MWSIIRAPGLHDASLALPEVKLSGTGSCEMEWGGGRKPYSFSPRILPKRSQHPRLYKYTPLLYSYSVFV